MADKEFKAIKVEKGPQGWGGPLTIKPSAEKDKIVAVTGGEIPKVAHRIAEMTGGTAVEGFRTPPPEEEIAAVVIDCGGTARAGVYPRKRIPTINLQPVGQAGPLSQFIKEDIYVSGVRERNISPADEAETEEAETEEDRGEVTEETTRESPFDMRGGGEATPFGGGGITGFIAGIGRVAGNVVGVLFQSGRHAVDQVIRNVLPFIVFVSMLIGIINYTGLGNLIASVLTPLGSNLIGLLALSLIVGLPFLSPVLGPGAVIAQVVGVFVGAEIGAGNIPPQYALPALFAYNTQVGCDFIPVGLSLGEAEPKTVEIGVPAVLFSRMITGPIAVLVGFVFSLGLYQ
ncbi:MAG TPA: PTS glucitol/sorbitol transporter subunit IIB [Rubrobacteraceae bacterium]|jgi:PTS system glucitol/sorbitol-specific IIB component|nr:PTS glucitol/sorbitol transporter subunit IIB [Rubrobacteraceae bacterium]